MHSFRNAFNRRAGRLDIASLAPKAMPGPIDGFASLASDSIARRTFGGSRMPDAKLVRPSPPNVVEARPKSGVA